MPSILGAIVVSALALRLALVFEIGAHDLDLTAYEGSDMHMYWANAGRVAAGDLLIRERTGWDGYLDEAMGHERWWRMYGPSTYYNAPLYLYAIGLARAVYGADPQAVLLAQAFLSTVTVFLVFLLGRELFDAPTALLAAAMVAVQDTLVFYCGWVLRETLFVLLATTAALCATLAARRASLAWALAAGSSLSLAWLTKGEATFLAPLLLLPAIGANAAPRRLSRLAMIAIGALLPVLPFAARNVAVGVSPLQMSCYELTGFLAANLPQCPRKGIDLPVSEMRRVIDETDGAFLPSAVAAISRHASPWRYLLFAGRKLLDACNAYEPWNNVNLVYFRRILGVFRLPLLTSGLLLPLGFTGMALSLPELRRRAAIYGLVAGTWAFIAVSFVVDRYRLTAYPALALFAAHTVVAAATWARGRRVARVAIVAASVLVLALALRDRESELQIDRAAAENAGTYVHLGRPWAASYVLARPRNPTDLERKLLRDVPRP